MNIDVEPLQTERIYLIVPHLDNSSIIAESIKKSKHHLRPWLRWANNDYDQEKIKKMILAYRDLLLAKEQFMYYMWLKNTKDFIGAITLRNINWNLKTAELGYWLDSDYVGKGYMQEAIKYIIKYAFTVLTLNSLIAFTYADNIRSRKALEKCEFTFECEVINSESRKVAIYKYEGGEVK
ncbi:GNAT family N-acetyltransferase [Peribacillus simplex]|uniref:GNAT family N-acetyltransferase n=1 Tax=Peribacillus simplex TaxID=1478 RepID=UPI003CF62A26